MSRRRAILLFFPLCRTVKASEKMGQRRVAKSPAVPYEPLCDFLCFSPRKNSSPFRKRAKSRDLGPRKWGFLSGPLSKTWYFTSISAKLFQYNVRNNICRKKLFCNYWNILLTLFLLICFTYVFNAEIF